MSFAPGVLRDDAAAFAGARAGVPARPDAGTDTESARRSWRAEMTDTQSSTQSEYSGATVDAGVSEVPLLHAAEMDADVGVGDKVDDHSAVVESVDAMRSGGADEGDEDDEAPARVGGSGGEMHLAVADEVKMQSEG